MPTAKAESGLDLSPEMQLKVNNYSKSMCTPNMQFLLFYYKTHIYNPLSRPLAPTSNKSLLQSQRLRAPSDVMDEVIKFFYTKSTQILTKLDKDAGTNYYNYRVDFFAPKYYGCLIGVGGQVRRQLEHQHGVKLSIYDDDNIINIVGPEDRAVTAVQHMLMLYYRRISTEASVISSPLLEKFNTPIPETQPVKFIPEIATYANIDQNKHRHSTPTPTRNAK